MDELNREFDFSNYTGVILSPEDPRDYKIDSAMEFPAGATATSDISFPDEYEIWTPPVEKQYGGTCVAHSISQIFETINHNLSLDHRDYSITFIYGNRRQKNDYTGTGMIPRYACANMIEYGDVLRTVWEYAGASMAPAKVIAAFEKIYPDVCQYADLPFSKYVSLWKIDDIKAFIYKYKLPVIIVGPTSSFSGSTSDTGRHAVICYGWTKDDRLKFQNSWGYYCAHGTVSRSDLDECWGLVPKDIFFTDIEDLTWGEDELALTTFKGIMMGYADGTFKPNESITRHEMAVICGRLIKEIKKSFKK